MLMNLLRLFLDTKFRKEKEEDLRLVHNGYKGLRYDCLDLQGYPISFDSAMEANVYRWLTGSYRGKKFCPAIIEVIRGTYENLFFSYSFSTTPRGYVPDFKVITRKGFWYVEVKGCDSISTFPKLAKRKIELLYKNYPKDIGKGVFIITKAEYKNIEKHFKNKIKFWE